MSNYKNKYYRLLHSLRDAALYLDAYRTGKLSKGNFNKWIETFTENVDILVNETGGNKMDKLISLFKLEPLKVSRTKLVILIDIVLYSLVQFGILDKAAIDSIQPILLGLA